MEEEGDWPAGFCCDRGAEEGPLCAAGGGCCAEARVRPAMTDGPYVLQRFDIASAGLPAAGCELLPPAGCACAACAWLTSLHARLQSAWSRSWRKTKMLDCAVAILASMTASLRLKYGARYES